MVKSDFIVPKKEKIATEPQSKSNEKTSSKPRKKTPLFLEEKQKKKHISAYIRAEVKIKIEKLAKQFNCSESSVIEQCLHKFLKNY